MDKPDIFIKLSNEEYEEKKRLIDVYETQKHFLPNVVRNYIYKTEIFWRL